MRHLVDKEHLIYGSYTVKGGKLIYRTQGSQHAHAATRAKAAKREFKASDLNERRDFVGTVESVVLVPSVTPVTWEIVLNTKAR